MSPEEKFAGVDLKFIDSDDMQTIEECDYVMSSLDNAVGSIEEQLGRARSEVAATGRYGDRDWYRSAERALKSARRARVVAQNRRVVISRIEKQNIHQKNQEIQASNERAFIEAAKLVLDQETYLRIWSIAVPMKQPTNGEG